MTDIATRARELALSVEAKKHALRQQQDGCWILTMKVHQNDMPEQIMKAAMGQRYVLAMVAVDDNEEPKEVLPPESIDKPKPATQPPPPPVLRNKAGEAERRKSQGEIAGYLCTLPSFWKFLQDKFRDDWYRNMRVGRSNESIAANCIYDICTVASRRDLTEKNTEWMALRLAFGLWQNHPELEDA
jgi:hypothetical protein